MKALPPLSFKEAYKDCLSKYRIFNFKGRARRSEYWNFYLFYILQFTIFHLIIFLIINFGFNNYSRRNKLNQNVFIIEFLFMVFLGCFEMFLFIPLCAVMTRRLHDVGKPGVFCLINIVPIIGNAVFVGLLMEDSEKEANIYGPSPKYYMEEEDPLADAIPLRDMNIEQPLQPQINDNQNQSIQLNNSQLIGDPQIIPGDCHYNDFILNIKNRKGMPPLVPNQNYEPGTYQNI